MSLKVVISEMVNVPDGDIVNGVPAGGTTGQVLKKFSNTDFLTVWGDEAAGGGGGPQGPAWTYAASGPGTGEFTTDDPDPAVAANVVFSGTVLGLPSGVLALPQNNTTFIFTASNGKRAYYRPASRSVDGNSNLSCLSGSFVRESGFPSPFYGLYTISFYATAQTAADVGLGSVTNDAQVKVSDIGTTVLAPNGDGSALTGITSLASAVSIGSDVILNRDAADILSQRRGANAQLYLSYNTYTDGSNYERALFGWNSNTLYIGSQKAGTGSARPMALASEGVIYIQSGGFGSTRWKFDASGHFIAQDDTTYDIGASGGKPRDIYIGRNIIVGSTTYYPHDIAGTLSWTTTP